MRELLARMRVGSPNNKIPIKSQRTNMEINSNLSRMFSLWFRNLSCKKYLNLLVVRIGENISLFSRSPM